MGSSSSKTNLKNESKIQKPLDLNNNPAQQASQQRQARKKPSPAQKLKAALHDIFYSTFNNFQRLSFAERDDLAAKMVADCGVRPHRILRESEADGEIKFFNLPGSEHIEKNGVYVLLEGYLEACYVNETSNTKVPVRIFEPGSIIGLEVAVLGIDAIETVLPDFTRCDQIIYVHIHLATLTPFFETFSGNDRLEILARHCGFLAAMDSTIQLQLLEFVINYFGFEFQKEEEEKSKLSLTSKRNEKGLKARCEAILRKQNEVPIYLCV